MSTADSCTINMTKFGSDSRRWRRQRSTPYTPHHHVQLNVGWRRVPWGWEWSGRVPAVSDLPARGRAGFKCCRWCDRSTARKVAHKVDRTAAFEEIPVGSMIFGTGTYWHGLHSNSGTAHANSRFLCNQHDRIRQRQEASAETTVHLLHTTPLLLPPDRLCGVCARLVVNQNNGLETEQVVTVYCAFMCAHCVVDTS